MTKSVPCLAQRQNYQPDYYTAVGCPADKQRQEHDFGVMIFTYTATGDVGVNGSVPCVGFDEGNIWMSPATVKPPGGWPALAPGLPPP